MKKLITLISLLFTCVFAVAQTQDDFKVFLESFRYENKQNTIIMLGKLNPPTEFGCGTAAMEYYNQIHCFTSSAGEPVNDFKLLHQLKDKSDFPVLWYHLYGSFYDEKEVPVTFKDNNELKNFLLTTTRLGINFEKINRKSVIYHCAFTNVGQGKRTTESYHLLKENSEWKLDKVTIQITERKFDDPYLYYLKD